jgi:hypothetical protein
MTGVGGYVGCKKRSASNRQIVALQARYTVLECFYSEVCMGLLVILGATPGAQLGLH